MTSEAERVYPPMHPGRVLDLEFLEPLQITSYKLAKDIGVDAPRVYGIVRAQRSISADSALRFARYFGTSAEFWLNPRSSKIGPGRASRRFSRLRSTPKDYQWGGYRLAEVEKSLGELARGAKRGASGV